MQIFGTRRPDTSICVILVSSNRREFPDPQYPTRRTQPARRRRIRPRIHGASRRTANAANVAITGKKLSRLSARYTAQDSKKTK